MRIISKQKEYYDYLVGYYGLDKTMVYDRRTENIFKPGNEFSTELYFTNYKFSICNRFYTVYQFETDFYHTIDDLLELHDVLRERKVEKNFLGSKWMWRDKSIKDKAKAKWGEENGPSNINKVLRQPVLIQDLHYKGEFKYIETIDNKTFFDSNKKETSKWSVPYLTLFGFARFLPADELYQNIYSFLSWMKDNPEIPNKQTNIEKLESHGFDKKISFRHRK